MSWRVLTHSGKYISYSVLKKDNVPCDHRGKSYYNCAKFDKANPYKWGFSTITHCVRSID
ncbi:hypothetical protein ACJRO7_001906 [Eucalyptus globulus]|uniref:Uncharacterized protein n=1 Tax=Eucalyptus globulus TaxID=34317 RepID=A0ABD3LVT4_EUCGL